MSNNNQKMNYFNWVINDLNLKCWFESQILEEEKNITNLKNQLSDLEKKLYWDKVDWKIWTWDSEIDNEYLKKYQEKYISNDLEKLNDLSKKIEFLKSLLDKFSKEQNWLDWLDLSDKKYDKLKDKIIWYWNKENLYDLVSNIKKTNDGRYEKFEELITAGNISDAYLILFSDWLWNNWKEWIKWINKINNLNEKKKEEWFFSLDSKVLIEIWKENDEEKIKKYLIDLSNKDFFQYNNIVFFASDEFKWKYFKKYENISNSFSRYLDWFKWNIADNILKNFHNSKINIFENFNDFKSLYDQILKADNINDFIKTKVFWISNYMSSEILFNVENFITMMEWIYWNLFKEWKNEIANIQKLREWYNAENAKVIDHMKSIESLDENTMNQIKNILKTGNSKNLTEMACKVQDKNNEKSNSIDFNSKIKKILELDWVKELLKNESWNKKAEKLINLLFNSVESTKNEVIDWINNVLNKDKNKELKDKIKLDWYIVIHWDTKKEIFDTDRVIREVNDDFYKEELKSKEQWINPKTKLQVLDEKLKAIWLDKLSKEDFNSIRNQFKILLDLEDDKETLKELDKKIKENPDLARVLISWTDEERRKLFKEVEDAKQDNLDKKNIDKTNQENLKINQEAFENVTLTKDESWKIISYNYKNQRLDLKELWEKEISDLENNPEKVKKLIDFKLFLEETGLWFLWQHRENLAMKMNNKWYAFNYMDANWIWDNWKDAQEQVNLLNFIWWQLWFEHSDKIEIIRKSFIENKNKTKFEINWKEYTSSWIWNVFENVLTWYIDWEKWKLIINWTFRKD